MATDCDSICPVCDGTGFLLHEDCPLCGGDSGEGAIGGSSDDSDAERSDSSSIYDENDERSFLPLLPPARTRWTSGSRVTCDRFAKGTFHAAQVTGVNRDGSYNVVYKSGVAEYNVPHYRVAPPNRKAKRASASAPAMRFSWSLDGSGADGVEGDVLRSAEALREGEDSERVLGGPILDMLRTMSKRSSGLKTALPLPIQDVRSKDTM
eukprot:TRINITY_DN16406_c0_g1_i2.p1 TRINITY_DN16406_c0_g1~~TRINITY_DN16406_c0_g1_i2.p1  ORF type:complete len:208 (+),score=32.30 TRINITY_DN16406_c0_g1_i2:72-695(+)